MAEEIGQLLKPVVDNMPLYRNPVSFKIEKLDNHYSEMEAKIKGRVTWKIFFLFMAQKINRIVRLSNLNFLFHSLTIKQALEGASGS